MAPSPLPTISRDHATRLWLDCQGLLDVATPQKFQLSSFVSLLERTGGLQIDTVNVVERAHYLTLWSRFGPFPRDAVDGWIYRDQAAFEYWGHEASILPSSYMPYALRRMKLFPPESWRNAAYWQRFETSTASKRRVLKRLREHGPLDSRAFASSVQDRADREPLGWGSPISKEDKRSLELLWHAGKVAVVGRQHFRKIYDLAERYYPATATASRRDFEDSWLLRGLGGNGIASRQHLDNYLTATHLKAAEQQRVIERNVRSGRVRHVRLEGFDDPFYALPEQLEQLEQLGESAGTTLLCPFDSLLWQRRRAEQLLDYHYRIEIYVPEHKRQFGYYAMPILHEGRLVGRIDPKLHRDQQRLEIKSLRIETNFLPSRRFNRELLAAVERLATFVGAQRIDGFP